MLVYESQRRQQWRTDIAPHDAVMLKRFLRHHRSDCLRDALVARDMERMCFVLEAGADPSTELRGGLFPLMAAVLKRSVPYIKRLVAAGADVDVSNSRGMTALMWAVKRDDYAMVDALLNEGADVGVEGSSGWTAISIAARHGRREIAQLLVDTLRKDKVVGEMNADRVLNHRSTMNAGLTPVAIAAIHRNESMVRCLMRLGANPRVKCHRGFVAGEHATKAGWSVFGLWLQETRAFGANGVYTFADINSENALRVAGVRMLEAISSGATIEDELKKGLKKNISAAVIDTEAPGKGSEPLELVDNPTAHRHWGLFDVTSVQLEQVRSNTVVTVKVLQEGHTAPDTEADSGHTALISAAYRGLANCVRLLIQEGADSNYSNRNDRTALMAAAAAGHQKVVVALLAHGANASWLDIDGKVAGAYAFERGFLELSELLAIASSQGNEAALEWERDRGRRQEEEIQRQRTEIVLKTAGGGTGDVPEADLHDWMIRVTKPREAARLADLRHATCRGEASFGLDGRITGKDGHESPAHPHIRQSRQEERCPKCTLVVPCLHFDSLESLRAEFPEGVPEWAWNKRGVNGGAKRGRGKALVNAPSDRDGFLGGEKNSAAWWRVLHKVRRDRVLPVRGAMPNSTEKAH